MRRAGLPYAVTQGFSPHMRVGFSSALPVGTSSTCEWYDLFMTEFVALDEAFGRDVYKRQVRVRDGPAGPSGS